MSAPGLNAADAVPRDNQSPCEMEQIHIPGAIQPHGAMIAALTDGLLVTHASANLESMIGRSATSVLGMPLEDIIGVAACRALQDQRVNGSFPVRQGQIVPGPDGTSLHLLAHTSGSHICIDIERTTLDRRRDSPFAKVQSVLDTFHHASTTLELCKLAVDGLKTIGNYDRVMAYRFAADGHGEVVAEAREAWLEPFLGMHYPAADIPKQARRQYLRQRVGAIADSSYEPVPLLVHAALDDGTPLDLTYSMLRSVSPYHREYMRNMKTAASLTVGLSHGGELWGLLVCHSATPLVAEPELRSIADTIGQAVSLLLGSLGEAEVYADRLERISSFRAIADQLGAPAHLADALVVTEYDILDLVAATGAVVALAGEVRYIGRVPQPEAAEQALNLLRQHAAGELLARDDIGLRYPELAECAAWGAGAMFLPLGQSTDDAILWFRPELSRTIIWGGNPDGHATVDPLNGRVSLRTSFASWKKTVNGRSAPWLACDIAMAHDLRSAIETELARRTREKLRQTEVDLEHRVAELEQIRTQLETQQQELIATSHALAVAKEAAEAASLAKSEFLAMMKPRDSNPHDRHDGDDRTALGFQAGSGAAGACAPRQ